MIKEGKFIKLSDLLSEALHNHMGESGKTLNSRVGTSSVESNVCRFHEADIEILNESIQGRLEWISDIRESVYHHSNPYHREEGNAFHSLRWSRKASNIHIEAHLAGLRYYRILTDSTDMTVWFHTPFINLILNRIKRVNAAEKPTCFGCPLQLQLWRKSSTHLRPSHTVWRVKWCGQLAILAKASKSYKVYLRTLLYCSSGAPNWNDVYWQLLARKEFPMFMHETAE